MTEQLGTEQRPLRVAIIGAGPSGFYAAGSLLQQKNLHVSVDMFDRLPAPFGLVRYGVAPDHQKIKSVTKVYERTAADPRFRFFGNVEFGDDVNHDDLRRHYDQVIYAVGAQSDRRLGIPGEDLGGSISATEFVAWYNGHPDYAEIDIDLSVESVVVVGVGNVAMDVSRILAKTVDELQDTDIADHALAALSESRVTDIYILARRGPAQAKFTNPEIREFGELSHADPVVPAADLVLDPASATEAAEDSSTQRNLEILHEYAARTPGGKPRRVHFLFLVSPVELIDDGNGRVGQVVVERNELRPTGSGYLNAHGTGETFVLPAGLVLRSVGYKGVALPGVPYDARSGTIPNRDGRVLDSASGQPLPGEYVVGWAKRGPSGIIGTNKPDAAETVQHMVADVASTPPAQEPALESIVTLLQARNVRFVTMDDWRMLDQLEIAQGASQGRPRVKLTSVDDMLEAVSEPEESMPA